MGCGQATPAGDGAALGTTVYHRVNFRDGLRDYLRCSGQRDGGGVRVSSTTETGGRYHARWLCMMYPRLLLARDLLCEEGLIFVSIGDHEVHNLRHLMDELFWPENFLGTLVWKSRVSEDTRARTGLSNDHEYIACYPRSGSGRLRGAEKDLAKFSNPDGDARGAWRSADLTGLATRARRPNLHYDLIDPETGLNYGCPPMGWRFDRATMSRKIEERRIRWPASPGGRPRHKLFLAELRSAFKNTSSVILGTDTAEGTREVNAHLGAGVFPFPKPTALIRLLVEQATEPKAGDIVLDFFAGSGSTGEAVWRQNLRDGGDRRFILVQFPEPTGREDYPTISAITRARLLCAAEALALEPQGQPAPADLPAPDLGFRLLRLEAGGSRT